jgi:hypothetical protein
VSENVLGKNDNMCSSCGNTYGDDNLCMPSACQWEGVDRPATPSSGVTEGKAESGERIPGRDYCPLDGEPLWLRIQSGGKPQLYIHADRLTWHTDVTDKIRTAAWESPFTAEAPGSPEAMLREIFTALPTAPADEGKAGSGEQALKSANEAYRELRAAVHSQLDASGIYMDGDAEDVITEALIEHAEADRKVSCPRCAQWSWHGPDAERKVIEHYVRAHVRPPAPADEGKAESEELPDELLDQIVNSISGGMAFLPPAEYWREVARRVIKSWEREKIALSVETEPRIWKLKRAFVDGWTEARNYYGRDEHGAECDQAGNASYMCRCNPEAEVEVAREAADQILGAAQPPAPEPPDAATVLAGLREEMTALADEYSETAVAHGLSKALALVSAAQQRLADRGQGGDPS